MNIVYKIQERTIMDNISLKALAKINLGLDVVRRREDGYHEVRMIMQTIHLFDRLDISKTKEPGIQIQCNLPFVPTNESNLVYKAAKMLMEEFNITEGVSVNLQKRIPVAAGMAGGSTDGAAMLYGMNQIFELGLSQQELMKRGVKLGADVPYCLMRGTALAEGIGEELTQLPPMVKCPVLIAKPAISVSTKFVYENLRANELEYHPDIDGMIEALDSGDLKGITDRLGNVLETVTVPAYPIIQEIKDVMLAAGAENALMSGSGPTVFGIFTDKDQAEAAAEAIRQAALAKQVFVTGFVNT
jgi:4-diphosphocytidyl-2-C-methyl-D-erythritol kinase